MNLLPELEGDVPIRSSGERFLERFRARVNAGLLSGQPQPRSNYTIGAASPGRLEILAADWATATNVGLNRIELQQLQAGVIRYHVTYWRWARFALALSGGLGLVGVVMLVAFDARAYIARHPDSMMPGLSVDQNFAVAWLMVAFWGFIWPWLLISMHKRPLHRLVTHLITEVDRDQRSSV